MTTLSKLFATCILTAVVALTPTIAVAQSLENNPTLEGQQTTPTNTSSGLTVQSQTPQAINPLWFIVPIAVLALAALWVLRPSNRQTNQRHIQPTYSIAGVKGGEASSTQSQYRTDNDVYADSLNDQEVRLRRIFDEPTEDEDGLR